MKWYYRLSLLIVLPIVSGCIPLPAPSIVRTDDKLTLGGASTRAKEDTVLIFGHNAEPPPPVDAANRTILAPKGLADEMGTW